MAYFSSPRFGGVSSTTNSKLFQCMPCFNQPQFFSDQCSRKRLSITVCRLCSEVRRPAKGVHHQTGSERSTILQTLATCRNQRENVFQMERMLALGILKSGPRSAGLDRKPPRMLFFRNEGDACDTASLHLLRPRSSFDYLKSIAMSVFALTSIFPVLKSRFAWITHRHIRLPSV